MQGFAVKVALATTDESLEHTWVEVERMDGQTIWGKLANEPHKISGKKLGDPVAVPIGDVEDWIYHDGKTMIGGFTSKILQARREREMDE